MAIVWLHEKEVRVDLEVEQEDLQDGVQVVNLPDEHK